jgi:hypothetical protein
MAELELGDALSGARDKIDAAIKEYDKPEGNLQKVHEHVDDSLSLIGRALMMTSRALHLDMPPVVDEDPEDKS